MEQRPDVAAPFAADSEANGLREAVQQNGKEDNPTPPHGGEADVQASQSSYDHLTQASDTNHR